jgi:radical SAM protein with 4Fe4S-binding SPASM domain
MKRVNVTKEQVRLFNMIAIETSSLCNRTCVFCPNAEYARPDEVMAWPVLEEILEQLVALNFKGVITWYLYNEPFRDKRLLDIIERFAKALPSACPTVSTNGDYFKRPEDIMRAFDAGVRMMTINVYSAADGKDSPMAVEKGLELARKRHEQLQAMLDSLPIEQEGTLYRHSPRGTRRARIEAKYGVDPDKGKMGSFEVQNRAGNIPGFMGTMVSPLEKMCVRPFRFMNVNWRGDVILCCNDYYGDITFGNVMKEKLADMWNSDKMNAFRVALKAKDRDIAFCRGCDYSGGSYPHMTEDVTFGSKAKDAAAVDSIRNI